MDIATFLVALAGMIITIIGWIVTGNKQIELAKIQKEIQEKISEHNIRFETLHPKRVEVMEKIFDYLAEITRLTQYREIEESIKLYYELNNYFNKNDLFLDEVLSDKIKKMINALGELNIKGTSVKYFVASGNLDNAAEFQARTEEIIDQEIPRIKDEVKKEMRKILGIIE
jgi:hypothetical protein